VAGTGFDNTPFPPDNTALLENGGPKSGPIAQNLPLDPDLQKLIDVWPNLSKCARKLVVESAFQFAGKRANNPKNSKRVQS
jgi:hypothetical protein